MQFSSTLWCQLEDMFQLIVTPQGIEKVTIQLIDTPTKVYAIGARLFLSKVPLEVLQNWVLIQLIVTPHILGKVQGQIKEVCQLIEPCLVIGTREYAFFDKSYGFKSNILVTYLLIRVDNIFFPIFILVWPNEDLF